MEVLLRDDGGDAVEVGPRDDTAKVAPRGNGDNTVELESQDDGGGEAVNGCCPWVDGGGDERVPVVVVDVLGWRRSLSSSSLPVAVTAVEIAALHRRRIVVDTATVLAADRNRAQIVRYRRRRRRPKMMRSRSVEGRMPKKTRERHATCAWQVEPVPRAERRGQGDKGG